MLYGKQLFMIHTKHTTAPCGQTVEFLNVTNTGMLNLLLPSTFLYGLLWIHIHFVNRECLKYSRVLNLGEHTKNRWLPHICWKQGCNGIRNQFYSFQAPITAVYLFMTVFMQFKSDVIKSDYFLCSAKEQVTNDFDECSQQSGHLTDRQNTEWTAHGRMWWNEADRLKSEYPKKTCQSAMDWSGVEPGPPRRHTGD